jgi:hypothetical protein
VWRVFRSCLAILGGFAVAIGLYATSGELIWRFTTIGSIRLGSSPDYTPVGLAAVLARLVVSVAIGGFIASWVAIRARLWHATAVGLCVLAPFITQGIPAPHAQPVWYSVLFLVLIVPVGLLGGGGALMLTRTR